MAKLRGWIKGRPLVWATSVLIIGLIIGAAVGVSGKSSLESEKKELEGQVSTLRTERDTAETEVAAVETQRDEARERFAEYSPAHLAEIKSKSQQIIANAKEEGDGILQAKESEVEATEEELAGVEGSLEGAEHTKALSTFGEGIERSEIDFVPGTYEAPGGNGCYWATLNSANTQDIADNEYAINASQQIVTIETPYFQSSECGTWKLVE